MKIIGLNHLKKDEDEKLFLEKSVFNTGTFFVVLGEKAINKIMMSPREDVELKYKISFRPVFYNIRQAMENIK